MTNPSSPARSKFRTVLRAITVAVCVLVVVSTATGMIYQHIATSLDMKRHGPPGRLIQVGGIQLHCVEHGADRPTVVFDSAVGMSSLGWALVEPEVATFARTLAWDRPGYGWSDAGPRPQSSEHLVEQLHQMLEAAGARKPYVLVGSSFGGVNMRLFAFRYPAEVAGLVLVDPAHEDQFNRTPAMPLPSVSGLRLYQIASRLGLLRLNDMPVGVAGMNVLPSALQESARAVGFRTDAIDAIVAETASIERSFEEVRQARERARPFPLGNRAVVVLTRQDEKPPEGEEASLYELWVKLHEEIAGESTRGRHILVPNSGHFIAIDQPASVIEAIREVVVTVRDDGERSP